MTGRVPPEYRTAGIDEIELIRPLWEDLNRHHHAHARAFRSCYEQWTFDDRKACFDEIAKAGLFHIDLAYDPAAKRYIGYCISSLSHDKMGEIESVYVEKDFRSMGVGSSLMTRALAWLESDNPARIRVSVADGNEDAVPFYQKFGFYPRMTVLEQKKS